MRPLRVVVVDQEVGRDPVPLRGGLDGRRAREPPVREEGELIHLLGGGSGEVAAAVADVGAEEAGEPVEVLVAVGVPDVAALATVDDREVLGSPGCGSKTLLERLAR